MIQQLIEKYFSGQCTEAEKEKIRQYFRENPTEADGFFSEEEWERMDSVSLDKTERTEGFINRIITDPQIAKRNLSFRKWLIAAAVIACIGLAAAYFLQVQTERTTPFVVENKSGLPSPTTITQRNDQDKVISLALPDGSVVQLSPHSEIKYIGQFESNKRDIYLEGEGVFEVTKDAARPFTVYCKEVATTALGTRFKVSLLKDNDHVSVVLLEGKIVVKSTGDNKAGSNYYLLPGNEIQYSRKNNSFIINNKRTPIFSELAVISPTDEELPVSEEDVKINTEKKAVQFNDVSMAKALSVIAHKHGVRIAYPPDRIENIRFVGTVKDSDRIQKILSDIAAMNNLELIVDSTHNMYILR